MCGSRLVTADIASRLLANESEIMRVDRFAENPLIAPADVTPSRDDFEVVCVFNPGVVRMGNETLLLMRVAERPKKSDDPRVVRVPVLSHESETATIEILDFCADDPSVDISDPRLVSTPNGTYLTTISHLRIARGDGRRFVVDETPAIAPDCAPEGYGIEDPRITNIDGRYYIVYKSVASTGITQSMATTTDFVTYEKHGIILPPENMDAMVFPERVNGKYVALHRPFPHMIGDANMWIAYSDDILHWGEHRFLAGVTAGGWEAGRIGGGAVPFMTERGWLEIYHGATSDDHYSLGALLLQADKPERVLARSLTPIMQPEAPYETTGLVNNVVFTCGVLVDGDVMTIYYGAADTVIAAAEMSVSEVLNSLTYSEPP